MLADHDRPLARRGMKACRALRTHVRQAGIAPEVVLCSTARRAVETSERVFGHSAPVQLEAGLYHASGAELVHRLRSLEVDSAMVIGHNPALQEALLALTSPSPLRDRAVAKLPTGALATIELESWRSDRGELVALVVPREL